jgi:hypothetical protein
MTDDAAAAAHAMERQCMNGAFETVEDVFLTVHLRLKAPIGFVPADLTRKTAFRSKQVCEHIACGLHVHLAFLVVWYLVG